MRSFDDLFRVRTIMQKVPAFALSVIPLAALAAPAPVPVMYMYDVGDLGQTGVYPLAINNRGEMTGYAFDGTIYSAFITASNGKGIRAIEGFTGSSAGYAINDRGQVAGSANTPEGPRPFVTGGRESGPVLIDLPREAVTDAGAYGINNQGIAVGYYTYREDEYSYPSRSFFVDAGKSTVEPIAVFGGDTIATKINDAGQITGTSVVLGGDVEHLFVRDSATGMSKDYGNPTGGLLIVRALSSSGRPAGEITQPGNTGSNPFILSERTGEISIRPTLGGNTGGAFTVADNGWTAGTSFQSGNSKSAKAFVARAQGRLYDLNQFVINRSKNVSLIKVTGSNKRGQLSAWGDDSRGYIVCPTLKCQ